MSNNYVKYYREKMEVVKRNTFILMLLISGAVFSQRKYTISGYVKSEADGEALIGATVSKQGTTIGTSANEYGFYSLTLPEGKHTLVIQYIGYKPRNLEIDLLDNKKVDVSLPEEGQLLDEIVVTADKEAENIKKIEMGVERLDMQTIQKMPALMGEVDVIKSIQTLPGVTSAGEGATGFNVRGGNIDQNLVLLDEAPVYNTSHLFGFFSVFNPDAVKDVKLMKGAIPAQYGGRTSSVLDIRMKEGNSKQLELNGGVGTIFSRLSVEAPIVKDKASFIIAGRRSYIDVLARPFLKSMKDAKFYFYDLTAKLNWKVNEKNTVFLSGYTGKDVFGQGFNFSYGNATTTLRWNHIFSSKLFSNVTLFYSKYNYNLKYSDKAFEFSWLASIINYSFKSDFSYFYNSRNILRYGGQAIYYVFSPGETSFNIKKVNSTSKFTIDKQYALEYAFYVNNEQKISEKLSAQYGIRWSLYNYLGKGKAYTFRDTLENRSKILVKETEYKDGQSIKFYHVPEPRVGVSYVLNESSSVKSNYSRSAQYLQIASNSAASSPLDIYMPATNNIKPLIADQWSLGYFKNLKENAYETSVEIYYKYLQNQLDFIDNSNVLGNKYLEADLLQGIGQAYGAEFYVKKNKGKFTGWISYTWSRTERKIQGLSNNEWYLSRYDRTHNVNAVLMFELSKRLTISSTIVYLSGVPATFPDSKIEVQGYYLPYNSTGERSNYRVTPYHRLDLGLTYDFKKNETRRFKQSLAVSVYNVYNRRNAFSIYFRKNPNTNDPIDNEAIRLSMIGSIVPAVTYNFKF